MMIILSLIRIYASALIFSLIMYLVRLIFSFTLLFDFSSIANYLNPSLPRDFLLTQQVNSLLNALTFLDNIKEGINIVR